MFEYQAYVSKVYDGDTITCDVDCGFGVHLKDQKIRLHGINAPEMRGPERLKGGTDARDALANRVLNKNIILKTLKDKRGKYGRILGIVYLNDENINEWLLANGYANVYKCGKMIDDVE